MLTQYLFPFFVLKTRKFVKEYFQQKRDWIYSEEKCYGIE